MKFNQINIAILAKAWFLTILAVLLAGCSGGNGDVGTAPPGSTTPTSVSGKVTISSTVSSKPMLLADILAKTELQQLGNSKPVTNHNTSLLKALSATTLAVPADLSGATVELFDADKSEWLAPVASDTTDSNGNYSLNTLINDATNLNADGSEAYIDGNPVLPGNYTVIARKYDADKRTTLVAVQAIVKKFAGKTSGNNLVAQDSDAVPTVVSMLGLAKNSDGTFGSATTSVPVNANIQVFFSMAMDRLSVKGGISIKTSSGSAVSGKWKVSPDLTAATFYPDEDMIPDTAYTIAVTGGTLANAVKNVYDKALADDVSGSFITAPRDATPPTAQRNSPKDTTLTRSMPIITPIRIGVDEELDISSLQIISKPSIGDKPTIKYVGKSTASSDAEYPYIYEIVPSDALKLNTNYSISVSGGLDMVGLSMYVLNFGFTTETTSSGITGTTQDAINNQLAVKTVLGKWIGALNARNTALLTSYMTGDFFWLNDNKQGFSRNDMNRDGRLSLNEFTAMLNNWFKDLDRCGSTVTGDVDTVNDGIIVNGSTASIAFNIIATPTNTNDSTCDAGPDKTLYAVMENINQAWLMTSGSEYKLAVALTPLTPIELISPVKGIQLADPSLSSPPDPIEFQWTAVAGVSTYMLVAIDNQSRQLRTGWAALVDGASAGTPMSAKFIGKPGDYGNIIVLDTGMSNPLGFDGMITQINPGGDYSWAVIGFETKTKEEFKILNFNLADFLIASSESSNFAVEGALRELRVEVTGASGTVYPYSDTIGGYNVGSEASVIITVITPNATTQPGSVSVSGYVQKSYPLNFGIPVNGLSTAIATPVILSNVSNWVRVDDGTGVIAYPPAISTKSLTAEFSIYTKGGALPKIGVSSVTAKKCGATTAATLIGPNGWNNYSSADACTISVTGTVNPAFSGTLSIEVGNKDGKGNYYSSAAISGISYTFTDIPVYAGQNWVKISYAYYPVLGPIEYHNNNFGVDTLAGSKYAAPITATVTGATEKTPSDIRQSYWDAAALGSVSVDVTMLNYTSMATCSLASDPNYIGRGSCTPSLSLTGTDSTLSVTLYRGWNYINLFDGAGSKFTVFIYTTGGSVDDLPNIVTNISIPGGVTPPAPTPSTKPYPFDADIACAVIITGTTTSTGLVNVNLNYYNSTTKASFNEMQSVTASGVSPPYNYTFNQTVYGGGINMIDINDSSKGWQGVQVSSACPDALPVAFAVSTVSAGGTTLAQNTYGVYDTQAANSVTLSGTASSGKTVTAYVSGQFYNTYSTIAGGANSYSMSVPLYTGYNYLSLTDGSKWKYLTVSTTAGGASYTPPINNVAVSIAKLLAGGGADESKSSWGSSEDMVTISGDAKVEGTGIYYQSYNLAGIYYENKGTFTVPANGGAFTLLTSAGSSSIPLGYGFNEFNLKDAKGNAYSLTIHTTGGTGAPPDIVQITSPLNGDTVPTGLVKVYGTIASSFVPVAVRAYAYDYVTETYTYFSNQDYEVKLGNTPLDYSNGTFVFEVPIILNNRTFINVYADDANKVMQEQGIYVNDLP